MGINTHYYTILGHKIDTYDSDFVEEMCQNEVDHLADGMSGEYVIVGKTIGVSHDFRWEDGDGDNFITIDPKSLSEWEKTYKDDFRKKMAEEYHHLMDNEFKLYVILHYS